MITETFQKVSCGGQRMKSDCSEVSRRFRNELHSGSAHSAISARNMPDESIKCCEKRCAMVRGKNPTSRPRENCAKGPRRQGAKKSIAGL
jgi:hypothetical protein